MNQKKNWLNASFHIFRVPYFFFCIQQEEKSLCFATDLFLYRSFCFNISVICFNRWFYSVYVLESAHDGGVCPIFI